MTTLLLIRHGETDWVGKRLAGRTPGIPLNENGRRQAEDLADALAHLPLTALYSSPLERARQSAEPLARRLNLPVRVHNGLQEIDFGQWQGLTGEEMRNQPLWPQVQRRPSQVRFPGGESFEEAQQRMVTVMDELLAAHPGDALVACFSHSDSIRILVAHVLAMPLDAFQRLTVDPISVTVIRQNEERTRLVTLNHRHGPLHISD